MSEQPTRAATPDGFSSTHTTAGAAGPSPPPAGEFDLLTEIGRGGMGVVFRARDTALDREVAVKLLQEQFPSTSATAVRFLDEARITAQLQHPGIPPVYRIGTMPDGRPYLAMKLIRGNTLDELLKANAPFDPLAVFEAVCHAVGYAHAHGVIHRDLKPANVMVGNYGEVQVMDWGLAKVLTGCHRQAGPASPADPTATRTLDPPAIRTGRNLEWSHTEYGSILGTPSFMAPEQAAGEVDRIDRRSDVFGLGAILCVLLTGHPPFGGEDAGRVRLNAVRGRCGEAFARLDGCGADPGVIALCKRCLAFEPSDRPADANEIAAAVAALRRAADDRARQAELDRAKAEGVATEQRKRRRAVQLATGVVAVVVLTGVIAVTLGILQAVQARADAQEAVRKAEFQSTKDHLRTAQYAVRGTFDRLATGPFAEIPQAGELRSELVNVAKKYTDIYVGLDPNDEVALRDAMEMYRSLGSMYGNANEPVEAWTHYGRALEYGRRLVGIGLKAVGGDEFPLTPDGRLTLRTHQDSDGAIVPDTPSTAQWAHVYILEHARTCIVAAAFLRTLGRTDEARQLLDEATSPDRLGKLIDLCPAVQAYRRMACRADLIRAGIDSDEGRADDAQARCSILVEVFRELHAAPEPPHYQVLVDDISGRQSDAFHVGGASRSQALALLAAGRQADAESALTDAVGRLERSTATDDRHALGMVLDARGRVRAVDPSRHADAQADFDRAVTLLEKCHQDRDHYAPVTRTLADALVARGQFLAARGQAERVKARADFDAARALCDKLVKNTAGGARPTDLAHWADAEAGLGLLAEAVDKSAAGAWWESAFTRYSLALKAWPALAQAVRGRAEAGMKLARLAPPGSPEANTKTEK